MSDLSRQPFPRGVLLAAAALLGFTLLVVGASRWTGVGRTGAPESVAVEQLSLRFQDRPDGAVEVRATGGGDVVGVLEPGTNGFVRSVVRGLVRERRARGVGSEPAFQLTRWADGRFSLDDPATGRSIELGAFGPTNADAFARLLVAGTER